jgi:hypothetical protein
MAASRSLRFVLHVTLVVALFAGLASLAVLLGSDSFLQLDIVLPYSGLVAMAAVADASVAFWHDRRQTAAHG